MSRPAVGARARDPIAGRISTPGRERRRSLDAEAVEGDIPREPFAASVAAFFIFRILQQTESALHRETTRARLA